MKLLSVVGGRGPRRELDHRYRPQIVGRPSLSAFTLGGGMPRQPGVWIYVMLSLDVWFCDHSEWWAVWVICSTLGGGFGFVGGRVDIHIRVCMSNPVTKGCVLLPPRFAQ